MFTAVASDVLLYALDAGMRLRHLVTADEQVIGDEGPRKNEGGGAG